MVKLVEVNPADLPTDRIGRRGRVSYPLIKQFLESNLKLCKLDLTGLDKNPTYLRSVLYSYVKSHKLPIKIFSSRGDNYLMRLDIDNNGQPIEWKHEEEPTEGNSGALRNEAPLPIDSIEVVRRFQEEQGKTTK